METYNLTIKQEKYFEGKVIIGAYEFAKGKFLVCIRGEKYLKVIYRDTNTMEAIENSSGETLYYQIAPIPTNNQERSKLVIVKDRSFLSVVDVDQMKSFKILPSVTQLDADRNQFLDVNLTEENIVEVHTLEFEKGNSRIQLYKFSLESLNSILLL